MTTADDAPRGSAPDSRPRLTRDRIVTVALEIVDREGIEALSMRKLGSALGVEAMSVYNHIANKDAVLDAILDRIIAEIVLPDPGLPWEEQLRALAHRFRRAGHLHPRAFPLFGSRAIRSIEGYAPLEAAYRALRDAGMDVGEALDSFLAVASYVFGFVLVELGGLVDVRAGRSIDFASVDLDAHPRLVELGTAFFSRDADQQFSVGLERMLEGIATRIPAA